MFPRGLEPRTLRLLAVRSNQLSYETSCTHPARQDRKDAYVARSCKNVSSRVNLGTAISSSGHRLNNL
jgi:hypothetical protein